MRMRSIFIFLGEIPLSHSTILQPEPPLQCTSFWGIISITAETITYFFLPYSFLFFSFYLLIILKYCWVLNCVRFTLQTNRWRKGAFYLLSIHQTIKNTFQNKRFATFSKHWIIYKWRHAFRPTGRIETCKDRVYWRLQWAHLEDEWSRTLHSEAWGHWRTKRLVFIPDFSLTMLWNRL